MTKADVDTTVVIVGGGPVGLFLGICLQHQGISCKVLEKREKPVSDSRSLGIHPVSLELFDELGISSPFLEKGLKVNRGIALTKTKTLGEISFEHCPPPHNYVLICPQFYTEQILRKQLLDNDDTALLTGAEFLDFKEGASYITARYTSPGKNTCQIKGHFLVGCDGKKSIVRQQASIHFSGKRYPDTYIMGDFEDHTGIGNKAAIFLPKAGLIESFPFPGNKRRWVVKTNSYIESPHRELIEKIVKTRVGYDLEKSNNSMMSSFGVQHFMAEFLTRGRVLLAGDAAHVVSPIGGQGMNLGWLGAGKLAECISKALGKGKQPESSFKEYQSYQQGIVKKAARRAEINMMLGRKRNISFLRNLLIRIMLNTPLSRKVARLFTMRGLENWWI